MDLLIREATVDDAGPIALIYNQAVLGTTATFDTETKTAEDRALWLRSRGARHPVIVAERDGRVLGWGALSPWSDRPAYDASAEISFYVDGACARQGVGRALAQELLRVAPGLGFHNVLARICTENEASISLARQLGMAEAGTLHEVGHKFDRWLDVVILERVLGE